MWSRFYCKGKNVKIALQLVADACCLGWVLTNSNYCRILCTMSMKKFNAFTLMVIMV